MFKRILNACFQSNLYKFRRREFVNHLCQLHYNNNSFSPVKEFKRKLSHKKKLDTYLSSSSDRSKLKAFLPDELFILKRNLDNLYLIDPDVAGIIAAEILPNLEKDNQLIAECTPGLGLISKELLKSNIDSLWLYEPQLDFREYLTQFLETNSVQVHVFPKNFLKLHYYDYLDQLDNGNRVEELLQIIPKRSWNSEPVLTLIGPIINSYFLRYLARSIAMQTSLAAHGRIELFLIMKPVDYFSLCADISHSITSHRYMMILFNLFFDCKLLCKLPRKAFLPWEQEKKYKIKPKIRKIDEDKIYLAHVCVKKDLPLPFDQLVPFYFFVKQLYKAKTKIIPLLENWVPGCGENIIWPKLHHLEYYEDLGIHTEFKDLTPVQIVGVFKEMCAHPSYLASPFSAMVEGELIKSETIESKGIVISPELEKHIAEDIEATDKN